MREIKFRAYAQADKTWHYWDVYGEYPQGIYGGLSDPQQYTGLKDKNGVDIYEGDYVHRADGYIGFVEYGRVLHSNTGKAYSGFYLRKDKDNYTHIDGTLEVLLIPQDKTVSHLGFVINRSLENFLNIFIGVDK